MEEQQLIRGQAAYRQMEESCRQLVASGNWQRVGASDIKLFLDMYVQALLLAQGKKGVYLGMLTGSVAVNILCNMFTIPLWGKMGAAVASVVSYTVAGGLFLAYYLRMYGIPLRDVFLFKPQEIAYIRDKWHSIALRLKHSRR